MRDKDTILLENAYQQIINEDNADIQWDSTIDKNEWDSILHPYIEEVFRKNKYASYNRGHKNRYIRNLNHIRNLLIKGKYETAKMDAKKMEYDDLFKGLVKTIDDHLKK